MNFSVIKERVVHSFNLKGFLLGAAVVLTPFICVALLLIFTGNNLNFSILVPTVSDEFEWFSEIEDMYEFGMPQGYCGYNGTHAVKGTFGPWGFAPMIPYAVFARLFGWKLYSMAIANIVFLSASLLVFVILTKPNNRQKLLIILTYCCMNIVIHYTLRSMSEGLRYSCGIVLAGILIWLERKSREEKQNIRTWIAYAVIGLVTFYIINVYLIFALIVPLYCWLMLRKKHIALRISVSIVMTIIYAVAANVLVSLVSSPYIEASTVTRIIETIKAEGIYKGICFVIDLLFTNLGTVNLPVMISGDTSLFWYFSMFLAILLAISCVIIKQRKQILTEDNGFLKIAGFWMMAGFLVGYCMLYTGSGWTLCRGTNTGLLMTLLILIFTDIKIDKQVMVAVSMLSIMNSWYLYKGVINEKKQMAQYTQSIIDEREKLEDLMPLSNNGRWANTVAYYGFSDTLSLAFPSYYAGNSMMNQAPNEKAKYAAFRSCDGNRAFYEELLLSSGHTLLMEDDFFVIYIKN